MELLWSTADFVIAERPYPGFPILLWDSMASCAEVNLFFRHYLLRAGIGSNNSWASIGRALFDFFSFLQTHELDWRDVDRGEEKSLVAAYRSFCMDTCGLARSTTRNRLIYICKFYEFANTKGWIKHLPFNYEERHVSREYRLFGLSHPNTTTALANNALPRHHQTLPKYLTLAEIKKLLSAADNYHHRIIIRLALHTGLRRNELATFPLEYVFNPDQRGRAERNLRIRLDPSDGSGIRTKGNKSRDIYLSREFMVELYHYTSKIRGQRSTLGNNQKELFLNHLGKPYSDDGKSLNRIIADIGKRVGLNVHTHMLRHTYATHTLANLQRSPVNGIDPLIFLQRQLGHSSLQTTMMYLHLINEIADQAVLEYDEELNLIAGAV
ncbi:MULTISPECIES: tyrosine-type recombinase/integrase [unclassified Pseudomonas]|uniref:tyrosine-type recombinase/integrase n=1 Tax=unclassified Pseudomonas TaxID=196821 RepID=UPI000471D190|nr:MULTISPECIES: tyrosine-type recombinase/integrase [unclassified Pseudomonas]